MPTYDLVAAQLQVAAKKATAYAGAFEDAFAKGEVKSCATIGCDNVFPVYGTSINQDFMTAIIATGALPPALSRQDNRTYICSECGEKEGISEYLNEKMAPIVSDPEPDSAPEEPPSEN